MSGGHYNVLFLCTGNSARSIMAESILRKHGSSHFTAFSAGSHPRGEVQPLALKLLSQLDFPTDGLWSKDWSIYGEPGAPQMDFVFTVCDQARNETCPIWPGQPMSAHWGVTDPGAAEGSEVQRMLAFRQAFNQLERRIQLFVALPIDKLDRMVLQSSLDEIGTQKA